MPAVGAGAATRASLQAFGDEVGWPVVVKTPRGGYDGKGVRVIASADEAGDWLDVVAEHAAAGEGCSPRGCWPRSGSTSSASSRCSSPAARPDRPTAWQVVETVQTDGICTEVLAPAPGLDDDLAARVTEAGLRIAGELGVTGVMAVELFEVSHPRTGEPAYVVNELAMRPHNSGHWSIDGAVTSQFEQHLRAVLDLPLGDPSAREPWTVMGNVLGGDYPELYPAYRHLLARDPGLKMHLYGKGVRPGRKIGHVNVSGDDLEQLRARAAARHRLPAGSGHRMSAPVVGVVMGSDSDWPVMEAAAAGPGRVRHRLRGGRRVGAPHAAGDGRVRRVGVRPRAAGPHRRRRRRGAPAGDARCRSRRCRSSGCRCR